MESTTAPDERGHDESTSPPGATVAERFAAFHARNPHIYRVLVTYCRDYARATGGVRFGIRPALERVRWDLAMRTVRPDGEWKLDNRYAPYYARLIACQEEDLAGLFETRRAPEADEWAETLPCARPASGGGAS